MMQIEGLEIKVSEMFYRAVVQAVLIFVSESWVLSEAMDKTVEGAHTGFMCQIMGKRAYRNMDGVWVTLVTGEVQEAVGVQSVATYIGRIQGCVAFHPIFELCVRENIYYGGEGHRRYPWWWQEAPKNQLRENLEDISWEASVRRRRGTLSRVREQRHWG